MKNKKLQQMYIVMGALCLILVCSSLAMAANGGYIPNNGLSEEETSPAKIVPPPVPNSAAKLAALIAPLPSFKVVLAKGVANVTNPDVGIYCIQPSSKAINIDKIVPVVSVEWGYSAGDALLAFYEYGTYDCPAGYIEVRTYNFGTGTPVLADTVAFTIIVQ